ncbi:iron uptake system protein EfeO [Frigoribacterium sp. CFBP 13707]|jgi:iron uptake system component EfeO|uniref:iron uptake system protein EfeO n=1 Tax=Frigoribacterium sp. CFBP 13707 TaxID=2775313 RepID=UPI00178090CE|nr:iron uptake system protein EfeO [Frigoribacterium sp. CFBP 13707]MBD8726506.1 peptidase M75 family protein [Frigoribacterium sp. CFBP 13707]
MTARPLALGAGALLTALALTGCVANSPGGSATAGATTVSVQGDGDRCEVSATSVPSGPVTFTMTNAGSDETEFELLGDDGLRIVSEKENIGPGTTASITVAVQPGDYYTACIPGLVGEGVRAPFTVTDSGTAVTPVGTEKEQVDAAAAAYVAYVDDQVGQLVPATQAFLDAYRAGDDATARSLYPSARAHYERIEPVAESFGDLDPKIDFREADVEPGTEWTGWHRIEKDLWQPTADDNGGEAYVPLTPEERGRFADLLTADTADLQAAVTAPDFTVGIDTISNGAVGLMDEVATGKITGEEEIWSHTDLYDFQANLEGARVAYEGVRDIVAEKDPELTDRIDAKLAALEELLASYGSLDAGFPAYTELTTADTKSLSDAVNALSEPLSELTAALVS